MIKLINVVFYICFLGLLSSPCKAGEVVDDTLQAINLGDLQGIQDGLRRGLDVNYADQDGNTLLMLSARSGHAEGVALLLNAGAKVYPSNRHGDTALLLASFGGYENVVDMLLAKGGSLGGNAHGWTPLHYAAFAGHARLVAKFLQHRANINAKTQIDLTPLMVATMNGHLDVVQILLKHNADTMPRDANGRSARDHALARGNTTIADELIRAAPKQ